MNCDIELELISDDTNYLTNNDVFIAKKGKNIHIEELIKLAKLKNPKYIISNFKNIDSIYIKNIKKFEKKIIDNYKVKPIIIGVTGTNGKTSTTSIIYSVLKQNNKKVMLIGSNGIYFDNVHLPNRNTTPSKISILYLINKYLDNDSYLVIELSSQSYKRIKFLRLDYLIFTNLTKEHLDTHKFMFRYFKAKKKIINLLKDKKNLFVNTDNKYGLKLMKIYKKSREYSLNDIKIISNNPIEYIYNNIEIKSKLCGNFNIYNLHSSYLLLSNILSTNEIRNEIYNIEKIEGRNNVIDYKNNKIVIDYAHTPYSFQSIIEHYSNLNFNNLYILFGFGGNRDKKKRINMLEVANKYSSNIILTEDNSRNEMFINIMKTILNYNLDNLVIIQDRKEAIKYAIKKLNNNDCLLILGKGNEMFIQKNNQFIKHNDLEEVKKWLM